MNIPKTNIRQLYHVACTIGEVVNGKLRAIKSGDGRNLYHDLFVLFYPTAKE